MLRVRLIGFIAAGMLLGGCGAIEIPASTFLKAPMIVRVPMMGKKSEAPADNSRAKIEGNQIKITEQIKFETGSAHIDQSSNSLLDEIADVLKKHPEIKQIEIAGYTDNVGSRRSNKTLSDQRAASVRDYLQIKGIPAARLLSKGYGPDNPRSTNDTDEGRRLNRRVEFHILP